MKIAFVALDDMVCEWIVNGLQELDEHKVDTIWLNSLPPYSATLVHILARRYDLIVYAGPAGGPHAPSAETLRRIREDTPIVFLCFDASDVGWHALLAEYRRQECFDLIVNCDGAQPLNMLVDMTLWCPVGRSGFSATPKRHGERPVSFGFCGGHRAEPRYSLVSSLVRSAGLTVRPREDTYGTYKGYTGFLEDCRLVLNVTYSAGGPHGQDQMTKQFKARIVECGFAGCAVLETRGSAIVEHGLVPGVDFLAYETAEEAAWIASTASAGYLQEIADNLHRKITEQFSPQRFWARVFERLR